MEPTAGFAEFVLDLLAPVGGVSARRMFGGVGLFRNGVMFALIDDDTLYMKVDDHNRTGYQAAGMGPFTYRREGRASCRGSRRKRKAGREVALSYYEAPPELFDDADLLCDWARSAHQAAVRAPAKGAKR